MNNTEITRQKNFRSALGGYNKDDVNQFIKETDLAFSAKEQEFTAKLAALEEELAAANNRNNEYCEKIAAQDAELAKQSADIAAQTTEIADLEKHLGIYKDQANAQNIVIEALKNEAASLREKISSAEEQLNAANEKCTILQESCADSERKLQELQINMENAVSEERSRAMEEIRSCQKNIEAENETSAYKLEMYDKISAQIGDILLNANRNADEILSAAKDDAEKIRCDATIEAEALRNDVYAEVTRIRSDTENEANYIRERLSDTANQLLAQISSDMHGNIENCIKEVNTCIQEMQYDTEHMLSVLKSRYLEMNDRIQYYQTCVTDSVSQKLQDMDEKYGIRQEMICADNIAEK